jgi:hemoglobin
MKNDIRNLDDIMRFVDEFYKKVGTDDVIGPVFNAVIQDWTPHLNKMYKFWNAVLFGVPGFKGNPFAKHAQLPITGLHFDHWLLLFRSTIDEHFEGPMATDAKNRAELMANMFLRRLDDMRGSSRRVIV